jgi:proteasome lid subunit RPN8/RPN11
MEKMPILRVRQPEHDGLRRHGEESGDDECCGVLLGHFVEGAGAVDSIVRTENAHNGPIQDRYQIASHDLLRVQQEARRRGLEIVGFYHSHPGHPAQWSHADMDGAHWLGCYYVITRVARVDGQFRAQETNAFLLAGTNEDDKHFVAARLVVTGPDAA